jgi:peptide/nickel transport system permease protein
MLAYITRRVLTMIPLLIIISMVSFFIIQLPPGDFLTTLQAEVASSGGGISNETVELLRQQYGLDQPVYVQYLKWVSGFPRGDFGYSFEWSSPVLPLLRSTIGYTILLGSLSLVFMFGIAIPIGVYSATHQHSLGDNLLTGITFVGLSIPGFLLALIYLFGVGVVLHIPVGGVISPDMANAPMSAAKLLDYFNHLWPPALILALAGTAQLVRIMRSNMLEVLSQQYITTARAKGLPERTVINKFAVRPALNPLVSVLALEIPKIIDSSILVGVVLSVPTTGPLYLRALLSQDLYLGGTFLLMMAVILMASNLLADIALAWIDPRISYD